jgi:hypothetical protein
MATSISGPMSTDERLLYEHRVRMRQAAIAVAAAVLLVVASVIQIAGPHTSVNELTLDLVTANKRVPLDQIGSVINGLGLVALGWTLWYLFECARARNEGLKPFIAWIAMGGAALAAIAGVGYYIVIATKASDFVSHGTQTYMQAHQLTGSGPFVILPFVAQLGALMLAVGFVLVSLNAMRVGLLTKMMGYIGVFAAILVLFQITQVPIVQAYWLLALSYLLSGRWPTGVPPAWRSGKAEPWPSSQAMREQRIRSAGGGRGKAATPTPAPETVGAPTPMRTRSATPKRKRKRRN